MGSKKIWQSAVAQILSEKWKGLEAPDVVAKLARELRGSRQEPGRTDLRAICAAVGLGIQYKPIRVDSLLHETESGFVAVVNSAINKPRQRFSIAHEIGHVVLYKTTGLTQAFGHLSADTRLSIEASEVEHLCDWFASELLMPLANWQRDIVDEGISLKVVKRLVSRYGVSLAAAAKRVVDVNVWKCAIAVWEPIYEADKLVELKPVQFSSNIAFGSNNWPKSIPNRQEFCIPGSPLYALEQGMETTGEISLPFDGVKDIYLAQSSIVRTQPTRIATLILAERYGRRILNRARGPAHRLIARGQRA